MSKNLIDTNLIIRFLLNDDPTKSANVEKLLKDKRNINFLLDTVIAEIAWVLGSYYQVKKEDIIEKLVALTNIETIECNNQLINKTLYLWKEHNISYIDAYLAAVSDLGEITLYTYDKHLASISTITAKSP